MRTDDGCFATNERAAAFAASSRDGDTSVAAMLFDTSNASTTVPSRCGSATDATGRVSDSTMTASAAMSSAGPRCRHRAARRRQDEPLRRQLLPPRLRGRSARR